MLELIGTAVVFWIIWLILDSVFRRKPKQETTLPNLKPGEFIVQADDGNFYVVRETEPEQETVLPEDLPDNVVRFAGHG